MPKGRGSKAESEAIKVDVKAGVRAGDWAEAEEVLWVAELEDTPEEELEVLGETVQEAARRIRPRAGRAHSERWFRLKLLALPPVA